MRAEYALNRGIAPLAMALPPAAPLTPMSTEHSKYIVIDRGPQFTNTWLTALYKRLGTQQCLSTAYHLESDGQTERVSRVLTEMLRHFVNKKHLQQVGQMPRHTAVSLRCLPS